MSPGRVDSLTPPPVRRGATSTRLTPQVVRVYSLARTVADCFRFRNQTGLDVALEALTAALRSKRLNIDELNRIAKKLRVHRVTDLYESKVDELAAAVQRD